MAFPSPDGWMWPRNGTCATEPRRGPRARAAVLFRHTCRSQEDIMFHPKNGAEVILELLRTNSIDCVFASPIAVMAPLW